MRKGAQSGRQHQRRASSIIISVGLGFLLLGPTTIAAQESDGATPDRATSDRGKMALDEGELIEPKKGRASGARVQSGPLGEQATTA